MFVAIILPPMRRDRGVLWSVAIAAGISCLLRYVPVLNFVSEGFAIIISAVVAALLMAWLCPIANDERKEVEHET